MTRLEPGGSIVIVMQRWHQDDLIGRILREMPDAGWKEVRFPAIAEEEDVLGRKAGEALFPERYSEEYLLEVKRTKSAYWWNSQYQQRPSPPSGAIFLRDHWVFYKRPPEKFERLVQSWDMAFKGKEESDFVAGHVWGKAGADYYMLDRTHGKMGVSASMQGIRNMRGKHPKARAVLVEDAANGPAIVELLKREISGMIAVKPEGGKIARANAVEPFQHAGNIFLPDPSIAPWVKDFVEECANFPTGVYDDDVDAMTQAIIYLSQRPVPGFFVVQPRRPAE
jgi:predicted phage terminase large subunit-like protein